MVVMHRASALVLLCSVASVTLLALSYNGDTPSLLEEYSVLPNSPTNYPTPFYPGATDEDQSPSISPAFERDVKKSKVMYKKLKKMLESSSDLETAMDGKVTKAMNFVQEQVTDINQRVVKMNKVDTDKITDVPLLPGPPGLNGIDGLNGRDGDDGPSGPPGSRGPNGASGAQGSMGPAGNEGFVGDMGPEGNPGWAGGMGTMGFAGGEGQEGSGGGTASWGHTKFECAPAATQHMRLVHCNRQGCRFETFFAGKWGTVCDRGFSNDNAAIMCKALGFSSGRGAIKKKFSGGTSAETTGADKVWMSQVQCLGGEGDIGDCKHAPWGVAHRCTHRDDVGMCCFGFPNGPKGVRKCKSDFDTCPDATADWARLRECSYKTCRLDVKYDNKWGSVCDAGFTDSAAQVVCKSLGFAAGGEARRAGGGKGPIWLGDVECSGKELNLEWCKHSPWGNTPSCDHSMDAGVCCQGPGKPPARKAQGPKWPCAGGKNTISSGATRLVECTKDGCRLEIKHEDKWGTVCSQDWKSENAGVACRSLGLPGGKTISNYGSKYKKQAPLEYKIWVSQVRCKGDESWLGSCPHLSWGEHECSHDQDVGICCEKAWAKPMMYEPAQPLL